MDAAGDVQRPAPIRAGGRIGVVGSPPPLAVGTGGAADGHAAFSAERTRLRRARRAPISEEGFPCAASSLGTIGQQPSNHRVQPQGHLRQLQHCRRIEVHPVDRCRARYAFSPSPVPGRLVHHALSAQLAYRAARGTTRQPAHRPIARRPLSPNAGSHTVRVQDSPRS